MSYDFMKNAMKKQTQNGNEYTVKEFHGRLWKNKTENPKAPVLKGNINVGGEEWQCSLFKNDDGSYNIATQEPYKQSSINHPSSKNYISPEKEEAIRNEIIEQDSKKATKEFNDDIPF